MEIELLERQSSELRKDIVAITQKPDMLVVHYQQLIF